jgi:alkyl sulfatase BDS1-like metallo-beta-lactamase superfamily hydrolase
MGELPSFADQTDFENAGRGFVAALAPGTVTSADGRVIWDCDAYAFLAGQCPDSANPSLWRQGQLTARQGLFEVTEGIYQVRGLDISNVSFIEADRGVIVIDPLTSVECAAAALGLYQRHRGERPVTAVIYTHSHADHFGGVRGVLPADGAADIPVIAPAGFLESAVSENVYAGTAMNRRAVYMYGAELPKDPKGHIGCGLGLAVSTGTVSLVPPTLDITHTGQEETVDGVRIVFQITPGTEAPAEMNFSFPARRAVCMAENATHTLHNLLTLRGAVVRNPHTWARYLTEAIELFAGSADVVFASHHWPTWGREHIEDFLTKQRDLYAYLHDQTLRMMNKGYTGTEIAEVMTLPPALEHAWHARGYYGSVSHDVKAIYQHYMGWFDGNPAHLWELPPQESARRHVEYMGGAQAVIDRVRTAGQGGGDGEDLRWAAQVLNYVVFADPGNAVARELLAGVYDRLGQGAENATWRNFYLQGADELRGNLAGTAADTASPEVSMALTVAQLFDSLAIRVDGPKAADQMLTIDWNFTDLKEEIRLQLNNGVLTQTRPAGGTRAQLTLTLIKPQLLRLLATQSLDGVQAEGDTRALTKLLDVLDTADNQFAIVTP